MFCRVCGNIMNDNEKVCSRCGALRADLSGAKETRVCSVCGNPINGDVEFCNKCGASVGNGTFTGYVVQSAPAVGGKSKIAAGLLGIFLGGYGVHNFYLGYTKKAVLQLVLSVGGLIATWVFYFLGLVLSVVGVGILLFIPAILCAFVPSAVGVWTLIESIMILCGKIKVDGKGNPLAN